MAYVDEIEDKNPEEPSTPNIGAPSQLATGAAGAPSNPVSQKGSGRFADLGEYLRVNQGQKFGEQVAGKVGEDVSQAGAAVESTGKDFKQRVDASKTDYNPELINAAVTSPEEFVKDEGNLANWNKQLNADYKGPTNLIDTPDLYSRATGALGKAAGRSKASETEGGRFGLLDTYFGRPNYTQGEKTLDNLLVQNDPKSQQAFSQMRENAKAVESTARAQAPELRDYGASAKGTTEQARNKSREAVGIDNAGNLTDTGPISSIVKGANEKAELYGKNQTDRFALLQEALRGGSLAPGDRQALGLQEGGVSRWDLDPTQYLTKGVAPTANSVVSKQDETRLNALSKLAGRENTWLPDEKMAGTYDPNNINFDSKRFAEDTGTRQKAYENEVNSATVDDPALISSLGGGIAKLPLTQAIEQAQAQYQQTVDQQWYPRYQEQAKARLDALNSQLSAIQGKYGYGKTL